MDGKYKNIDLGKTQITDKVRVSSAAIYYESWFGNYYQLETFIFSSDKEKQKTRQIIHKTIPPCYIEQYKDKIGKIHNHISNNLKKKLCITQ